MFRGIYTAANGMMTKQRKIETIANNLANTDTTAYKKDAHVVEAFAEKLLYKRHDKDGVLRATQNISKVENSTTEDGKEQIQLEITRGYIQLRDKNSKGYYKSASLVRDDEGYLRTAYRNYDSSLITEFGSILLDEKGDPVKVPEGKLGLDRNGNLTVGGRAVAKIVIPEPRKSIGTINSGALTDRIMVNYIQGSQEHTENPMHISIEGDGFFKVRLKDKDLVKYTRSGVLDIDSQRRLIDKSGSFILSKDGEPIEIPEDSSNLEITRDGQVFAKVDGEREELGQIDVVDIENKKDMKKYGLSYFEMMDNIDPQETEFQGRVLQGYLERSNVNPIDEMVNMIDTYRGFESDQKVINSYDQIMQKAANEIGKI